MRAVADTSFLIAAIHEEDTHHVEARARLQRDGPPALSREALAELLQVSRFNTRKQQGGAAGDQAERDALAAVLDDMGALLEDGGLDLGEVRRTFLSNRSLSWVDAAVLVQARGRELWTFDHHQQALHDGIKRAKGS